MTHPNGLRSRLSEMRRQEALAAGLNGGVVLVPVGATEQHGPHLPTGTDTELVHHVVWEAAGRVAAPAPIIVAPTLPFGCSQHHVTFGGTASLSSSTLLAVLRDVGNSLVDSGFRRLFFVNGHGGNHQLLTQAATDLMNGKSVHTASASWWQLAFDQFEELGALRAGHVPGHAGSFETSAMLSLQPDLVVEPPSRVFEGGQFALSKPLHMSLVGAWDEIDGWSDNPSAGNAESGAAYIDAGITALATAISEFVSKSS